jgi:hypothetical protein
VQRRFQFVDRHPPFGGQACRDGGKGFTQVAVVIDRIDDRRHQFRFTRIGDDQLQLRQRLQARILRRHVGDPRRQRLALLVHRLATGPALRAAPVEVGFHLVGRCHIAARDFGLQMVGGNLGRGGWRLGLHAVLRLFVPGLQHQVGVQRLAHLQVQLQRAELQQPDRLQQLRRHDLGLTQMHLQIRFGPGFHVPRSPVRAWASAAVGVPTGMLAASRRITNRRIPYKM